MKSHIKLRDKIILVMLVIVILGNFIFSKPVHAKSLVEEFFGSVTQKICSFVVVIRRYCNECFTNQFLC